jgi:enamine deaminase RidA (YjgF/YER057c/UK114 family)
MKMQIYDPADIGRPMAQYSHVTRVSGGDTLYLAGQLAIARDGSIVGVDDFEAQCDLVFANIGAALRSAGATFENVVQFTVYVTGADLIARLFAWRIRHFPALFPGGVYPPSTLLVITALARPEFLIEVQTLAVVPSAVPADRAPVKHASRAGAGRRTR